MNIRQDDLTDPRVIALLEEHLAFAAEHSPPESRHALDVAGLKAPDVTFWTIWGGDALLGCGALKELDGAHGEIKSMRTARDHLRKGVAAAMLQHIIDEARARGYTRLSLDTGSMEAFAPARALYAKYGFVECAPFANYKADPNNICMTLEL